MQLISTLLERNPFGGTLDADVYKQQVRTRVVAPLPSPQGCAPR